MHTVVAYLFVCVFVCARMYVHVHVCAGARACTCTCTCGGLRLMFQVFLHNLLPYFLKQGLSLESGAHNQPGWLDSEFRSCLSPAPSSGITGSVAVPALDICAREPVSGFRVCMGNNLPSSTESSGQPPKLFLLLF